MKSKPTLLLPLLVATSLASAAQFESIIDAMAIKSAEGYTNNSWEDTAKIKGVKWRWPYYESGAHDSTMEGQAKVGKDRNPNIGATRIMVSGARTMLSSIKISISNESADISAFGKGTATKIATSCDEDAALYTVEFYRFQRVGYKPLYISYMSSWGASGAGGVDFEVAYKIEDVLDMYTTPCKVLK